MTLLNLELFTFTAELQKTWNINLRGILGLAKKNIQSFFTCNDLFLHTQYTAWII